jgi:hypothetical protein
MCRDDDACCCSSVILGIIFGLFALIGMLCMTAGYVNNKNKNGNMVPAACQTLFSQIQTDSCYRSCCSTDSNGKCIGCYYVCYSGYVTASIENITVGSVLKVYTNDLYANVNAYLNVNYPNGRFFSCYYTYGSSVSLFLGLFDVQGPYIAGIVFLSLAALVLLIWIIIAFPWLLDCLGGCCTGCCSRCVDPCRTCKRNMQKAKEKRDEIRIREAQEEANRQKKINQELEDIEAQAVKPPSHIQFAENPDYECSTAQLPTAQLPTAQLPTAQPLTAQPREDNEAFASASAPPLTNSTLIQMDEK